MNGDYLHSFLRPARELAEAGAEERKRERMAIGWTDRPTMPDK
jgi:hypothetical protein